MIRQRLGYAVFFAISVIMLSTEVPRLEGQEADDTAALNTQAVRLARQGRLAEAEPLFKQVLAIKEQTLGPNHPYVADGLFNMALLYRAQGRYAQAEAVCKRALAIREKMFDAEHISVLLSLSCLADIYVDQARYAEAEPLYKRVLAIHEMTLGNEHVDVADDLMSLANLASMQARFAEAEPLHKRALAIKEKLLGPEHPSVAISLNNMAILAKEQGRFTEAETVYKRAQAIDEKNMGTDQRGLASGLNNLAVLYVEQGRYAEAEPLYKRALAINEKALGAEHPSVGSDLNNLANLYSDQGRYAEAEPLYKRSLVIKIKVFGAEHRDVALTLNNLVKVYSDQGRFAEAEPLCKRALAINEKALGAEHSDLCPSLNNLAGLYKEQERYAEAEPLYKRALAIRETALGGEHPRVANSLYSLAAVYHDQHRYQDAERLYKRALAIREKVLGGSHPNVAMSLNNLASLYDEQGRAAEAAPLVDRAVDIQNRAGDSAGGRSRSYLVRSQIKWKLNRRADAIADLNQALQLAEQQRTQSSGGEQGRAQAFARFGEAYEQMVEWQAELGDVGAALAAVERSRARSLMDQMSAAHIDLLAGVSAEQAQPLRAKEAAAQTQVASIEKQLDLMRSRTDLSKAEREKQTTALQEDLVAARQAYADAFAAIRQASPAYRQMIGQNFKTATLEEIQSRLAGEDRLVLEYVLGFDGGYLLVIPPLGQKARIEKLAITEEQAAKLGVKAGPITDGRMRAILSNETDTGLLQQLRSAEKAAAATDQLAALWKALIPESERKLLVEGKLKRCIVIPDAAIAAFPFETLVVETGEKPKYLLDVGPPIVTAPSATLLMNLTESKTGDGAAQPTKSGEKALLSVADPNYGVPSAGPVSAIAEISARSRYGVLRGDLSPLPFTAWECSWVAETFRKAGLDAGVLQKANAREASVRMYAPGRKYLHFACHGLVDQSHGNLFGALALTPGPSGSTDPRDDGFLTLAEIYELNLRGTELSILSACDTNYGPNQKGEGSWSLSRGFLVAGSKRVVASNWLVDDEAGASLVSVFCADITKEKPDTQLDYAASLQAAKRWVRNQEKWRSPYYWGTFVLVGPN